MGVAANPRTFLEVGGLTVLFAAAGVTSGLGGPFFALLICAVDVARRSRGHRAYGIALWGGTLAGLAMLAAIVGWGAEVPPEAANGLLDLIVTSLPVVATAALVTARRAGFVASVPARAVEATWIVLLAGFLWISTYDVLPGLAVWGTTLAGCAGWLCLSVVSASRSSKGPEHHGGVLVGDLHRPAGQHGVPLQAGEEP